MATEHRGFAFAVIFIIIFGSLMATVPIGLRGTIDSSPSSITPIDPAMFLNFTEAENYGPANYTTYYQGAYFYEYNLGINEWRTVTDDGASYGWITLGAKIIHWGVLWLGQIDWCEITNSDGIMRANGVDDPLSFDEISADSDEGTETYSLRFSQAGVSAGSLITYYNETEYPNIHDAWDNDEVYIIHGLGLDDSATTDLASLLISLLTFNVPDAPPLVSVILATPIWACVVFLAWFIIKESAPFV